MFQELQRLGTEAGELADNPETCLALNRAYQEVIQENIKRIELVLEHNRHRQVYDLKWCYNRIKHFINQFQ